MENSPGRTEHGEFKAQILNLEKDMSIMRKEIFGNGEGGMKEQLIKLTQVLKIATFIGSAIGLLMIGDFFTRVTGTQPSEVKETVEQFEMSQEELNTKILTALEKIHEKVENDQ